MPCTVLDVTCTFTPSLCNVSQGYHLSDLSFSFCNMGITGFDMKSVKQFQERLLGTPFPSLTLVGTGYAHRDPPYLPAAIGG